MELHHTTGRDGGGVGWIRDFGTKNNGFLLKGKKGGIEKRVPEGGVMIDLDKGMVIWNTLAFVIIRDDVIALLWFKQ